MRMPWIRSFALASAVAVVCLLVSGCAGDRDEPRAAPTPPTGNIDYPRDVQTLLNLQCGSCHGTPSAGGLSLLTHPDVLAGGASGLAVLPGDGAGSLLITKLEGGHMAAQGLADLTPAQLGTLRDWIDKGARFGAPDTRAPSFGGVAAATAIGVDSVQLSWFGAVDGVPAPALSYRLYRGDTLAEVNTALIGDTPERVIPGGNDFATISGLAGGQTFYFGVRAQDPAGNRDANMVVAVATTFGSLPPVIYLTAIQPIFDANCIHCHNDANKAAGLFARLSLESYAQVMAGGMTGSAIVPGDPDGSLLVRMITGVVPGRPRMPFDNPGHFDTPQGQIELALIRRWIGEGALNLPPGGGSDSMPPSFAGATGAVADSHDRITVRWDPASDNATPAGGIRYDVYAATASGTQDFGAAPAGSVTGATSLQVTGLTPDTTYWFVVRATDAVGNGETNTVEVSATTLLAPDTTPPSFPGDDPQLASPAKGSTTVDLAWVAATDDVTAPAAIVYRVFVAQTPGGQNPGGPAAGSFTGVTTGQVAGLSPNQAYYFIIRAEDAAGNRDANPVELGPITTDPSASDPVPPTFGGAVAARPSAFDPVSGTGTMTLEWVAATDNITTPANMVYDIFVSTTSPLVSFGTPDFSTAPGATSFDVAGLATDQAYYYVVRARDEVGNRDGNTVEVMGRIGVYYDPQVGITVLGAGGANCIACHGGASPQNGVSFETYLDTVNALGTSGIPEVTPFDGLGSLIYGKTGSTPPFGSRMPLTDPAYFDNKPGDRERMRRWIDQGALEFPDVTAPTFAGVQSVTPVGSTAAQADWLAATDDSSWPGNPAPIFTRIYAATVSGGHDFRTPSVTANAGQTSATLTGLVPDTDYFVVARAVDPSGNEDTNTVEVMVHTPPLVPDGNPPTFGGLTAATAPSPTTIDLSWSAATDDNTPTALIVYDVYRALASGTQDFVAAPQLTTAPGATSVTDTTVAPGTTYFYVVRARDEAGNRDANTVERSATTPILDVTPPTFAGAASATPAGTSAITLTWVAATDDVSAQGAIVYAVYRALNPGGQSFVTPTYTTAAGVVSFDATGLSPDTTYYFVVRARDEAGNADGNTVEVSATTDPVVPPPPGTGVDYATQIVPIFNQCTGCHGGTMGFFFEDYPSIESSAIGVQSSVGMEELSRWESDLSYLVWKIEGRPGMSGDRMPRGGPYLSPGEIQLMVDWINQGILETPDVTPPTFGGATAASPAGVGKIRIDWTAATDFAGLTTVGDPINTPPSKITYNVYEAVGAPVVDFSAPKYVAPGGSVSFTASGLLADTTYYYVVRAVDVTGNIDGNTVQVNATTSVSSDQTPPVFAGASGASPASNTSIRIDWVAATDETSAQADIVYDIWQSTTSPIPQFPMPADYVSAPGATSFEATGLGIGQTYYFVVRARDESGNQDSNTVEVSATTYNDTTPPTFAGVDNVVTIDQTNLLVAWIAATDDQTPVGSIIYNVYMRIDTGTYDFTTPSYVSNPGVTSLVAGGLMPDTRYFFTVRAEDEAGNEDTNTIEDKANTNR